MKYFPLLAIISLIILLSSCTPADKLINSPDTGFYLLALTADDTTALTLIKMPENQIVSENIFFEVSSMKFNSKPYAIIDRPLELYFLFPNEYKILIFNKTSLKYKNEIDFSEVQKEPIDVTCPNSTDAYVVFRNCDSVALVDLTNYKVARWVPVGKSPIAITSIENRCFVLNSYDNTVSVIRTNTHAEESKIPVYDSPRFLGTSSDGKEVIVICLGSGKLDPKQTRTEAKIVAIDATSYKIINSINIETPNANAFQQFPLAFAIGANDWAFVGTNNNLIRFDAKNPTKTYTIYQGYFYNLIYNYWNNELLMINQKNEESWIVIADPKTGKKTYEIKSSKNLMMIFPIKYTSQYGTQ